MNDFWSGLNRLLVGIGLGVFILYLWWVPFAVVGITYDKITKPPYTEKGWYLTNSRGVTEMYKYNTEEKCKSDNLQYEENRGYCTYREAKPTKDEQAMQKMRTR